LPSTADAIASATGLDPLRARSVLTAVLLVAALALRAPTAGLAQRLVRRRRRAAAPQPHANVDGDRWPATGSLLTLDRVSAAYGALLALDGIDLTLVRGEVHAVIGPNGSGKSTVLRVATGVLAPTAGAVRIGAATAPRAGQAASRVRAGTGVVRTWQRTANLDGLDPRTQVAVGARARERLPGAGWRHLFATPEARLAAVRRRAHVEAALAVVGLAGATHGSTALDSAEQRVLQIARALATGAHGLLLDEPAAGMSAPQRQRLGELLRRLADRGLGVLLVEHDMRLVAAVADRVSVLVGGKVVAHGTPEQVRANPLVARAYLGSDG
jgi:ABC-type branched-subunit amino acid transport system ATPase component